MKINFGGKMANRKLIVRSENLPYLNLFDLNKVWLTKKQERMILVEQARKIRAKGYNITMEINQIEDDMSKAIVKLEKKNV